MKSSKSKIGPVKPGIIKPGGPKGVKPGVIKPSMKAGGSASNFAKLAPPYDKATYADKIAGATGASPKMKYGGSSKRKMGGAC
jgi:hypothetical protein